MDLNFLKQEIARKRQLLESQSLIGPEKKYFKRGELQKVEEREQRAKDAVKQSGDDVAAEKAKASTSIALETKDGPASGENERTLPRKEVIRRLRERNEPIKVFGETEYHSYLRLKHLELNEADSSKGQRNDFQEAMEQLDQDYLNEITKFQGSKSGSSDQGNKANDVKTEDMKTDMEQIKAMASDLGKRKALDDIQQDCETVSIFLLYILQLWGESLNSREEADKISTQGKIASATYTQTQYYLKPLLKQLKQKKVADDILKHLILIVRYLLERNYVKASDCYLQMAIGNAPWPIGVTMVGIHARTGREKIFSQNIAHVLNDETQRKYIQALKRLMTRCQQFFPTDPSRSVDYYRM